MVECLAPCGDSEALVKPLSPFFRADVYCRSARKETLPECKTCNFNFPITAVIFFPNAQVSGPQDKAQ